jgi:Tfp pilus assembly PilM family ATPase
MLGFLRNFSSYNGRPIGVELGSSTLRLAQVNAVGTELQLVGAAACDVPEGLFDRTSDLTAFFTAAVRRLLKTGTFKSRAAVLTLPWPMMFVRHTRMPRMEDSQLRATLQAELAGKLPIDPSLCTLRHLVAGDVCGDASQQEVILIATVEKDVRALLDAASNAGLEVQGVQPPARAIVDCFQHIYRSIPIGARSPSLDKVGDELELCRRYYEATFSDRPLSRILFVGAGARETSLCQKIAEQLALPAQLGDPLVRFNRSTMPQTDCLDRRQPSPDWACAIGLSLGAATFVPVGGRQ